MQFIDQKKKKGCALNQEIEQSAMFVETHIQLLMLLHTNASLLCELRQGGLKRLGRQCVKPLEKLLITLTGGHVVAPAAKMRESSSCKWIFAHCVCPPVFFSGLTHLHRPLFAHTQTHTHTLGVHANLHTNVSHTHTHTLGDQTFSHRLQHDSGRPNTEPSFINTPTAKKDVGRTLHRFTVAS